MGVGLVNHPPALALGAKIDKPQSARFAWRLSNVSNRWSMSSVGCTLTCAWGVASVGRIPSCSSKLLAHNL